MGVTSLQGRDDFRWSGAEPGEVPLTDPRATEASRALGAGDYLRVLALTEEPWNAPAGAWLDYYRGSALVGLGRTDEAVETFERAELRFEAASEADERSTVLGAQARELHLSGDAHGRLVTTWGRARAFSLAGRCPEARAAFEHYAALARPSDPDGAEMAARYAAACARPPNLR